MPVKRSCQVLQCCSGPPVIRPQGGTVLRCTEHPHFLCAALQMPLCGPVCPRRLRRGVPLLSVEDDMRFAHDREDVPGVSGRHLFLPFQTAGLLLSPVNAENPVYCVRAQKKRYPSRHRFLCSMVCCYDQCAGTSAVCYPDGLFPAVVRWNDVPL